MSEQRAKIYKEATPTWYNEKRGREVVEAYNAGAGSEQPCDPFVACAVVPAASGSYRDFSYIAPDLPEYIAENCVGCMECVQTCPDSAIWGRVIPQAGLNAALAQIADQAEKEMVQSQLVQTAKYWKVYQKKHEADPTSPPGGWFGIFVDPTKCKGCGECVVVCGEHQALKMIKKTPENLPTFFKLWDMYKRTKETPTAYINPRLVVDNMLKESANQYVGGGGSCMGCGEVSVIRQLLTATEAMVGQKYGIVAATGCSTVYGSTYPFSPYRVPWMNSLFENAPTVAMGVREFWNQTGRRDHIVWAFGGDGSMLDIGFQALSRMFSSGLNIKAFCMDTQVYSNTGGQSSTATFMGQNAKLATHGKVVPGKTEHRKELGNIAMMHPNTFVVQTVGPMVNHFYRALERALAYDGPALINVYTTCQPEHQVADDQSAHRAVRAVECRAFPLMVYDPMGGPTLASRLSLQGNPSINRDWHHVKVKGGSQKVNFVTFAREEGRFSKQFDKDGNPSPTLLASQAGRLANWRLLQEMAGIKNADLEAELASS
ncbi:MAG: 4Fe-4S binding protein [Magnetococcales bacterium]|nr:4Fe-4S binding protein [Magnetococcales bacterium]